MASNIEKKDNAAMSSKAPTAKVEISIGVLQKIKEFCNNIIFLIDQELKKIN